MRRAELSAPSALHTRQHRYPDYRKQDCQRAEHHAVGKVASQDSRGNDVWRAYVPELEEKGAATWGHTQDEALKNLQEVVQMVIEEMLEDGASLPEVVTASDRTVVAVTV